jgi:hypothetical protein
MNHFGKQIIALLIFLLVLPSLVSSGQSAFATCQSACNYGADKCFSLAGLIFGVHANSACSAAQGTCMAACLPLLVVP